MNNLIKILFLVLFSGVILWGAELYNSSKELKEISESSGPAVPSGGTGIKGIGPSGSYNSGSQGGADTNKRTGTNINNSGTNVYHDRRLKERNDQNNENFNEQDLNNEIPNTTNDVKVNSVDSRKDSQGAPIDQNKDNY